jgi:hypothetical protein
MVIKFTPDSLFAVLKRIIHRTKCPRRESNPQPSDPKSGALSIELRGRMVKLWCTCEAHSNMAEQTRQQRVSWLPKAQ